MTYGFQDNVARGFNLSPADADRAIAEAYEIAGGEAAFNWYTRETRRLAATFTGDDAPTELETQFLLELARGADNRGHLEVTRDELAEALSWKPRDIGAAITWGRWRQSFTFARTVGGEQYFGRQYSHHGLVGSMLTR